MRQLMAILELEGHFRGNDHPRFQRTLMELPYYNLGGFPIAYVSADSSTFENGATVPDFGHNYRCKCENPEPHGVRRYFGVTLYVDGDPSADDVLNDYSIRNGRLIVTGIAEPSTNRKDAPRTELEQVRQAQAAA